MLKMKNGQHFQAKKTSATPDFCKRNWFRTHGLGVMNALSLTVPPFFGGTRKYNLVIFLGTTVVPENIT